jgi:o-succinylbenzoate synthase
MIVSGLKYFEYSHPFVAPLKTATGNIVNRSGIIVALFDCEGKEAFGEIAPLELLKMTPLNECIEQIEYIKKMLDEKNDIEKIILSEILVPEVMFGIEQALESLKLLKNRNSTLPRLARSISINGLIGLEDEQELFRKTEGLIENGYGTIKIKINNIDLDERIEVLNRLGDQYGDDLKIRLDANKSLNNDEASKLLSMLNPSFIEYIEDPVGDLNDAAGMQENTAVNIALDEFITPQNVLELLDIPSIKYYVIKPVKLGFYKTIEIIKAAESKNKSIVISSMFESAVGRSGLVYLASLIEGKQAHGLDTKKYLTSDPAGDIYPCDKPTTEFSLNDYPPVFDFGGMLK